MTKGENPVSEGKVEALLSLGGGRRSLVGRDRIALLEAVGTHGSITKAAQAVGLSYKAAWDALDAVNNLMPRPAVLGRTGGRKGGGATLTEDGEALIVAFRLLEDKLSLAAGMLSTGAVGGLTDPFTLLWSLGMKTSARNAYRCRVEAIRPGTVSTEVVLALTDSTPLTAVVTRESVEDLGLAVGREVMALIKASFVILAAGETCPSVSARNRIKGTVVSREDGPVSTEITLEVGGGRSLTAVITRDGAEELALAPGQPAWALVKASHVILLVD